MNRADIAKLRESDDAAHQAFVAACAPVLEIDPALWARINETASEMAVSYGYRLMATHRAAVDGVTG